MYELGVDNQVAKTINHLVKHGWVTLRSMAPMLGYAHATGIYAKQKGKKAIPTILIGGTYRVYAEVFITTLQNVPEEDQIAAQTFLKLYYAALKEDYNV